MSTAEPSAPVTSESGELRLSRRFFNRRTLLSFIVAFGLLAFAFSRIDIDVGKTLATMSQANPALLATAIVVYGLTFPVRAARWKVMLRNTGVEPTPPVSVLSGIILLSWFANCLLPAKLGDVYRAYLLRKRGDVSLSHAGGTVLAERLIDFAFVLILIGASGLIAFHGKLPVTILPFLEIGAALVLLAGLALLALRRWEARIPRFLPHRLQGIYQRFHTGVIGAFGSFGWLLLYTPLGWLAEILRFWLVAASLGISLGDSVPQGLAVATFITLGSAIVMSAAPTPGGLGAAEVAMVGALALLNSVGMIRVSNELAVAAALLDRIISYWGLIAVGALFYFIWEAPQPSTSASTDPTNG